MSKEMFEQLLRENVPLAPFTTLGVGGPARYFAEVTDLDSLSAGVDWSRRLSQPLFVMAGGSNLVVADAGFRGLVLRIGILGIETHIEGEDVFISAAAGVEWDPFVEMCVANNWAGLECLSGIPGRVGATPIQNVGAYGQETAERFVSLDALDLVTRSTVRMSRDECEFGYRASRFRTRDRGRFIITSVKYRLTVGGAPSVRYADLKQILAEQMIENPRLNDVRQAVLAIRKRKAMVIDPADPDSRSVGSFFMNPVVPQEEFESIKERAEEIAGDGNLIPSFPTQEGNVKLSAAWLIERAGFKRGHVHGRVGTSSKHSLALINRGGATSAEVLELAESIKARVFDRFGVKLTPEPVLVGFE
jgi:UDP-N-acetylmuramate dehydrogenase